MKKKKSYINVNPHVFESAPAIWGGGGGTVGG